MNNVDYSVPNRAIENPAAGLQVATGSRSIGKERAYRSNDAVVLNKPRPTTHRFTFRIESWFS